MERCKHVVRLRLGHDHSILNPQKWHCVDCHTTESVWACLKCSHVACGRYMEEHSLRHYQESQHPLAMEVRELDVFCFACGDYVLNDNAEGDLKLLRGALSTVRDAGRRSMRSASLLSPLATGEGGVQAAIRHRRQALLAGAFRHWRRRQQEELRKRQEKLEEEKEELRRQRREAKKRITGDEANTPPRKSARLLTQAPRPLMALIPRKFRDPPEKAPLPNKTVSKNHRKVPRKIKPSAAARRSTSSLLLARRRRSAPGVTGLRNLGNTCYMNSILQVLSHLRKFRECFLALDLCETEQLLLTKTQGMMGGEKLVPPKEPRSPSTSALSSCSSSGQQVSLCQELHTLFRVMWSGRWTLVSPFAMLHSVWNVIPAFRGCDQQDAQEFLCELLDKVQQELEADGGFGQKHKHTRTRIVIPITQRKLSKQVLKVLNTIFHGQLLSQVTCLSCKNKSNTVEPFWDLSLEFPERYHSVAKLGASSQSCTLTEMLSKFTETEALEGRIYNCNYCNRRRRKSPHKLLALSEACKQLLIYRLPQVLRLHLKRFRWSGRNHREKIGVHVAFDQVLNIEPYCCSDASQVFTYDLSAVVMHHGKGFGSGHYTAYCYNTEGGFWVHCNDSEMNVCSVEEVCSTQAYILFYTQRSS
ncbi:ubiquitin carboxyl-terminal hydrolase 49 [Trichomycterus rosablanca]|uniref:ubiquitin carboxyl-terminal hydrolase 49 n=1 Tax=Trichomycterus rosablanca TaxID=2290929 RepID=UPI002F350C74